jgi:catechol 2,3-dioxygenase-like lactoylglutathione lyase family enzyme
MRLLLTTLFCGAAFAQQPAVIGILNYPHAVNDLDTTVAFYKNVFDLELSRPPAAFPNTTLPLLQNAPGITLRLAMFKMPGNKYVLELTHFSNVERKPAQPQHTDPGAADLELRVRDMDAVFEKIKKSGAPIITRSGAPVSLGPNGDVRSIMIRDPDGYILDVVKMPPAADAPQGVVYGTAMGLTVSDLDQTRKFYHEMLGFDLTPNTQFVSNKAVSDMAGVPDSAQYREMTSKVPGTAAEISFYEWKGVPRKRFHLRVYDPGAPALVLRVNDLEGMVKRLKEIGTPVFSAHGEIVQFTPTTRNIFVEDPNGVNLELYETKQ